MLLAAISDFPVLESRSALKHYTFTASISRVACVIDREASALTVSNARQMQFYERGGSGLCALVEGVTSFDRQCTEGLFPQNACTPFVCSGTAHVEGAGAKSRVTF